MPDKAKTQEVEAKTLQLTVQFEPGIRVNSDPDVFRVWVKYSQELTE